MITKKKVNKVIKAIEGCSELDVWPLYRGVKRIILKTKKKPAIMEIYVPDEIADDAMRLIGNAEKFAPLIVLFPKNKL